MPHLSCIARTSAGNGVGPQLEPWLVVSDPEDAVEISKRHLKKARIYQYVPPSDPLQAWRAAPPRSCAAPATSCLPSCLLLAPTCSGSLLLPASQADVHG